MANYQVGDLFPRVIEAFQKPLSSKRGFWEATPANERTSQQNADVKKWCQRTLNGMKICTRFDIDDDLLSKAFEEPSWVEMTQNGGVLPIKDMTRNTADLIGELRFPFDRMFMEMSGKTYNKLLPEGWLKAGCNVKSKDPQEEAGAFLEFDVVGVFITPSRTPDEAQNWTMTHYVFGLFESGDLYMCRLNQDLRLKQLREKENIGVRNSMCLHYFGINLEDNPIEDCDPRFVKLLSSVSLTTGELLFGEEQLENFWASDAEMWRAYVNRMFWQLILMLNYPWVKTETSLVTNMKKSKAPSIVPRDSYYRCRIQLPKPDGVDIRDIGEARKEYYGKRLHKVRGHWRKLRTPEGIVRKRTWINEHRRGDHKLGVIHKDYSLEGAKNV